MLHKIKDLQGDAIHAEDGEVGSVDDLYFDHEDWDVRYLVVNTRRWIPGRKYLVSPIAIDRERTLARGDIRVDLTREQISRCPTWSTTRPGKSPTCWSIRANGCRASCSSSRLM
jgi:sporulation protein YlmC with PRC-barrel domain